MIRPQKADAMVEREAKYKIYGKKMYLMIEG